MYKLIKQDLELGTFVEISTFNQFVDAQQSLGKVDSNTHIIVYQRDGETEAIDEEKLIVDVLKANKGRILRVYKNVSISRMENKGSKVCCGEGSSCYCVTEQNGSKHCEAAYCDNTHCWIVPCSIPCGC
jgi:hypothetical protein